MNTPNTAQALLDALEEMIYCWGLDLRFAGNKAKRDAALAKAYAAAREGKQAQAAQAAQPKSKALSKALSDAKTEAWLIEYTLEGVPHKTVFCHNAIGDYRSLDPKAKSFELVRRPAGHEKEGPT